MSSVKDNNPNLTQEIWSKFADQQHVFLATAEKDQPRVRPVTLIYLNRELFIATGSNDAKIKQIEQNPKTEFCLLLEDGEQKGTIRVECKAQILADAKVKAEVYDKTSFIREFFEVPEDPGYALLKLQPTVFEYMKPGAIEAKKVSL